MVSLRSRAVTQVALTVASTEDAKGTTVTLQATIDRRSQAAPAGIVTFSAQGKRIGEAAVTNGSATLTTQTLPAGLSTLTATYGGDNNFMPSQSATVRFYLDDEKN